MPDNVIFLGSHISSHNDSVGGIVSFSFLLIILLLFVFTLCIIVARRKVESASVSITDSNRMNRGTNQVQLFHDAPSKTNNILLSLFSLLAGVD